ncbi:hypothetical protein ACS0TY_017025 [Phlomoides rotata]
MGNNLVVSKASGEKGVIFERSETIIVGRSGTEMLTNEAGDVTSHLQGMFSGTITLLGARIKPVYVFDGRPPNPKGQELAKQYFMLIFHSLFSVF